MKIGDCVVMPELGVACIEGHWIHEFFIGTVTKITKVKDSEVVFVTSKDKTVGVVYV